MSAARRAWSVAVGTLSYLSLYFESTVLLCTVRYPVLLFHFGSTMYFILDSYGEYFRIPVHFPSLSLSLSPEKTLESGRGNDAQGRAEDCPEW